MTHCESEKCDVCRMEKIETKTPIGNVTAEMLPAVSMLIEFFRKAAFTPESAIVTVFVFASFAALRASRPPITKEVFLEVAGSVFDFSKTLSDDALNNDLVRATLEEDEAKAKAKEEAAL